VQRAGAPCNDHSPVRYRPGTGMHYPPAEAAQDFPDALRWLWRGYHDPM